MSTPPVEKLRCKGCCGDGLERTTAAERMALTAVIVMAGAMLGLGRVGGGSGWLLGLRRHGRWCAEGTAGCRVAPTSATSSFPAQVSVPSFRFLRFLRGSFERARRALSNGTLGVP